MNYFLKMSRALYMVVDSACNQFLPKTGWEKKSIVGENPLTKAPIA